LAKDPSQVWCEGFFVPDLFWRHHFRRKPNPFRDRRKLLMHSLGYPGGPCVSRSSKRSLSLGAWADGGRWKSASPEIASRITSGGHRQKKASQSV